MNAFYRSNCQTNLVIFNKDLSILWWCFINTAALIFFYCIGPWINSKIVITNWNIFKWAKPNLFLFIFILFNNKISLKNCRFQRDSNSDLQSRRRAPWPLDHHHHGSLTEMFGSILLKEYSPHPTIRAQCIPINLLGCKKCSKPLWGSMPQGSLLMRRQCNQTTGINCTKLCFVMPIIMIT